MNLVVMSLAAAILTLGSVSSLAQVALKTPTTTAELKKKADIATLVARVNEIPDDKDVMSERHNELLAKLPRDPANLAQSRRRAREDAQELARALRTLNEERETKAKEAIRLTCELYGIHPTGLFDSAGNPRKPLTVEFTAAKVPKHEWTDGAGTHAQTVSPDSTHLGVTWGDDTITITLEAFKTPGVLAGTLVHERVHVDQHINGTGDRMTGFERERAARDAVLTDKTKAALGYTAKDVEFLEDAAKQFLKRPGDFIPIPVTPGQKPSAERGFDNFGIDSELLAELNDHSNDLRRTVQDQSTERSRQLIERINDGNREVSAAFRAEAASRCNLIPVEPVSDAYRVRVGRGETVNLRYEDEDGFYASLLLVHSCTVPWQSDACNGGMNAIHRRWGERGFRKSVLLAAGSDQKLINCVWYMHDNLRAPSDYQEVRRVSSEFQALSRSEESSATPGSPPPPPRTPRSATEGRVSPPARPRCRFMGSWCDGSGGTP